ncbi:hypothetical protein VC279_06190 [Xanthomonas sp. WHRI 10064A]|uniref:hypothetical protein n=1 Tax=unclassified Xanthomonas TaxID=2643310 RepID=UPI002B22C2E4|nr:MULTISPECIES: hypothetical protein [unclassified Xanthomonas]MEA9585901.1 hypothetical protein [Xanthomonas sp. WHRI 10064B]MEA9614328.1 hypothetical protein [Xanthomonas sp. WHRI 10064A]
MTRFIPLRPNGADASQSPLLPVALKHLQPKPLGTGASLAAAGSTLPPTITFASGPAAVLPGLNFSVGTISAAADGTIWALDQDSDSTGTLQVYDYAKAALSTVYASPDASFGAICAVSADLVYVVATDSTTWIGQVDGSGAVTKLGSPPNGVTISDITAATDGTLWALDAQGNPYQYANSSWTIQNQSDQTTLVFTTISAGSADLIVGAATADGYGPIFWQWTAASGWKPLSNGGHFGGSWIAACADGSVWSLTQTELTLSAPGGVVKTMDVSGLEFPQSWTAGSQFLCCAVTIAKPLAVVIAPFTLGLLDVPATPWPAMNAGQKTAYTAVDATLGITVSGGIRAQYANTIAPLSSYQVELSQMAQPAGVSADDWTALKAQLMTELTAVIGVNALFVELGTLSSDLATIQSDQLQAVSTNVGLTVQAQGGSEVSVVLTTLMTTFLSRVGTLFAPPYGLAVSLIGSGLAAAMNYNIQQNSPSAPPGTLQVTYAKLAEAMANNFIQSIAERATQQTAIVTDWGKLSLAGQAISQGLWVWPDTLTPSLLAGLAPVWQLSFYQSLMPAGWQILQGEEVCGPHVFPAPKPPSSPNHAMMTKHESDSSYDSVYWYYICCALGSPGDITKNVGAYPSTVLTQDLFTSLGVTPSDFFGGQSGWSLPVVQSPGWADPDDSVQWDAYDPND